MTTPLVKFAVISDMHAFADKKNSADSLLDLTGAVHGVSNPLSDLIAKCADSRLKVDAVFCAGDICNRADSGGLQRAWELLHKLKDQLQATQLIATCGNHDLDSRHLSGDPDPDPKGALQSLVPGFPFDDEQLANKFWARNFVIHPLCEQVNVLNINSSAFHGGVANEIEYGRISYRTIDAIKAELRSIPRAVANIMLCHHHPTPKAGWNRNADPEFMKNGQVLIEAISEAAADGGWLIVHGHRHIPRIGQAESLSSEAPYVLGAGSLGARVLGVPNQFHIIELFSSGESNLAQLVGKISTWSWTETSKWTSVSHPGGLPGSCGFGFRGQVQNLASRIEMRVGGAFCYWSDIRNLMPEIDYLLPADMEKLERILGRNSISISRSSDGVPVQVGC